jgi:hypothetical protein
MDRLLGREVDISAVEARIEDNFRGVFDYSPRAVAALGVEAVALAWHWETNTNRGTHENS